MAQIPKLVRVAVNPTRPHRKGSRPNAATKKGRHHMAKAGTKRKAANGSSHKRNRKNAATMHHRRKHRNPGGLAATIGSPKELVVASAAGLISAVATRQLPQLILGANNTSWEGYGANFLTTIVATWVSGAVFGPMAGRGALIGGMVIVLDRILTEQVSPIGPYLQLSGVGDATAYSKLGTIRTGYYTHPNLQNPDGSMYVPNPFNDAAVQAVLAKYPQIAAPMAAAVAASGGKMGAVNPSSLRRHAASGMLLSSRFQGRFNQ